MKQGRITAAAIALLLLTACAENPDSDIIVHKDMEKLISAAQQTDNSKADIADLQQHDRYTAEELEQRRGFGHSSPELGLKLMEQCKIGRLWLVHHDPQRTDGQLLAREEEYSRKNVHFAREGEEILL